jgi:LacI family transcriptional regulator
MIVMFGRGPEGAGEAVIDDELGGWLVGEHLAGLGHHQVAILAGPANRLDSTRRADGVRAALAAEGLEPISLARGD